MKEIDMIGLIKKVLAQKKSMLMSVGIGLVCGVVIALSTPKRYTSNVLLVPELSSGGLGISANLADMASSFGLDIGNSGKGMDALYPEIYPEILSSKDFIYSLFNINVRLKTDNKPRTYFYYLTKEQKMPFWMYPKVWLGKLFEKKDESGVGNGKADPFKISKIDDDVCKAILGNISCLVDKKTSVIQISVTEQDPLVAAIVADTLQQRLQNYITDYRTKKARTDYIYYTDLYKEAKKNYTKAQQVYASFCDANQDMLLETYIAKRDELENEMQVAFTLMNQLSTQVQAAKAKIQERTPAYTMIEKPKMSHRASSMPRSIMVILTVFVAVMMNSLWVLFLKDFFRKL